MPEIRYRLVNVFAETCANLGGWWLLTEGAQPLHAIVRQATAISRPNVLTLDVENGNITVGGRVMCAGNGTLSW